LPRHESRPRSVVIHADDVGMCEATVSALEDLMSIGIISSASLMVPCPWFGAAAEWFREHPDVDVGVHITLTSEWKHYRWKPVSTLDPASGLLDAAGFLPRTTADLRQTAQPRAAAAEARAQVDALRRYGIEPTHIDAHMHAFAQLFPREYLGLANTLRVPARSVPPFNHVEGTPNSGYVEDRLQTVMDIFSGLPEGLSCVYLHPARDTPELRSIVPAWRYRVADWLVFQDPRLKKHLGKQRIRIVTYRELAGILPQKPAAKD